MWWYYLNTTFNRHKKFCTMIMTVKTLYQVNKNLLPAFWSQYNFHPLSVHNILTRLAMASIVFSYKCSQSSMHFLQQNVACFYTSKKQSWWSNNSDTYLLLVTSYICNCFLISSRGVLMGTIHLHAHIFNDIILSCERVIESEAYRWYRGEWMVGECVSEQDCVSVFWTGEATFFYKTV